MLEDLYTEHELSLCSYIEYIATHGFPHTVSQVIIYACIVDRRKGKNSKIKALAIDGGWDLNSDIPKALNCTNQLAWTLAEHCFQP